MNDTEEEFSRFLDVTEIFHSVQGETSLAGLPTLFIRLARCNLRCSWCDTPYSFNRGEKKSLEEIFAIVQAIACPYICITGGEPLLQADVHRLMRRLCDESYRLSLETGGSLPIDLVDPRVRIILDIKCPASSMSEKNCWNNLSLLREGDEVKFVLADENDYLYAKKICQQYSLFDKPIEVLFSPAHDLLSPQQLIDWILKDKLPIRLNLQIHKYIWSPLTRGV